METGFEPRQTGLREHEQNDCDFSLSLSKLETGFFLPLADLPVTRPFQNSDDQTTEAPDVLSSPASFLL